MLPRNHGILVEVSFFSHGPSKWQPQGVQRFTFSLNFSGREQSGWSKPYSCHLTGTGRACGWSKPSKMLGLGATLHCFCGRSTDGKRLSSLEPQVRRPRGERSSDAGRELRTAPPRRGDEGRQQSYLMRGTAGGGTRLLCSWRLRLCPASPVPGGPDSYAPERSRTARGDAGSPSTSRARAQLRSGMGTELRRGTGTSGS
jgi:hypothetical protein